MGLLWFRRSKAKDAQKVPGAAPPEDIARLPHHEPMLSLEPEMAAAQPRLPLKLRGVLLLNLKPSDGLDQIENAPPLGRRDQVITALQSVAPGITFDAAGKADYREAAYRLQFDLGPGNPVHAVVAAAEGDAAVELLRTVMEREGWRAYVPRAGVFVEPESLDLFGLPDDALPQNRF